MDMLARPLALDLPEERLAPPENPRPTLKCYCGAESGRARRRAQGDIPCDGTWCATRRQEAEQQAGLQ